MGSGTSLSWSNIAANATSVTVRPPNPASALAWAQEADPAAELLLGDADTVLSLFCVAFGMIDASWRNGKQIQTDNWSRIWSTVVDIQSWMQAVL